MFVKNYFFFAISFLISLHIISCSLKFDISSDREKCYIEELYKDSVMMVKWKIEGIKEEDKDRIQDILQHVHLTIIEESTFQLLRTEVIPTERGKISFSPKEQGYFRVCVKYHAGWGQSVPNLLIGIKINSDNMDEPDLKEAIKSQDIDIIETKIKEVVNVTKPIVDKQQFELGAEDNTANLIIKASRNYYYMTIFQIVVVLAVGLYQIFNFRKFLSTNKVI